MTSDESVADPSGVGDLRALQEIRNLGVEASLAVPAHWAPRWQWVFGYPRVWMSIARVLAVTPQGVEVWTAWSGTPSKVKFRVSASEVRLLVRGRAWDRYQVGPRRFWVRSQYRGHLVAHIGL